MFVAVARQEQFLLAALLGGFEAAFGHRQVRLFFELVVDIDGNLVVVRFFTGAGLPRGDAVPPDPASEREHPGKPFTVLVPLRVGPLDGHRDPPATGAPLVLQNDIRPAGGLIVVGTVGVLPVVRVALITATAGERGQHTDPCRCEISASVHN